MAEIPFDEETSRDWDWFAVDANGRLAHFATATLRRLPASVRSDFDAIARYGGTAIDSGEIDFEMVPQHQFTIHTF